MSEKDFVFAADRHGREDDAEGDIYIGAGDEIFAYDNKEDGEGLDRETGFYGNSDDRKDALDHFTGELYDRLENLSEEYDRAILGFGNHEIELVNKLFPEGQDVARQTAYRVADQFDNVEFAENEVVEAGDRKFYFDGSFQTNETVEDFYDNQLEAYKASYEEDDLEKIGEELDKEPREVTCSDVDSILEGEEEQDDSGDGFNMRDTLESIPVLGKYVFQPAYNLADKYLGTGDKSDTEDQSETSELIDIEKTEQHQQLEESVPDYEEFLDNKASDIDDAGGEVTLVAHGQPQTEEMPYASIRTREILERAQNIGAAYVGHFHGGFEGEQETEIAGVPVINPKEGYTLDHSGGALEDYETHQFRGEKYAEAVPRELEEFMSDEELRMREIRREAMEEAEDQEQAHEIMIERMQEEGIQPQPA